MNKPHESAVVSAPDSISPETVDHPTQWECPVATEQRVRASDTFDAVQAGANVAADFPAKDPSLAPSNTAHGATFAQHAW
jgi:hypothetical protein